MQVGKTKDQGLYNKPSAAVHPEALDAGNLPQYNKRFNRGWGGGKPKVGAHNFSATVTKPNPNNSSHRTLTSPDTSITQHYWGW